MFKWIYQAGAAHENERIRRLIAEFTIAANNEIQQFEAMVNGGKYPTKKDAQQIDKFRAAREILDRLIKPEIIGEREYGPAPIDKSKP